MTVDLRKFVLACLKLVLVDLCKLIVVSFKLTIAVLIFASRYWRVLIVTRFLKVGIGKHKVDDS